MQNNWYAGNLPQPMCLPGRRCLVAPLKSENHARVRRKQVGALLKLLPSPGAITDAPTHRVPLAAALRQRDPIGSLPPGSPRIAPLELPETGRSPLGHRPHAVGG